MLSEQMKWTKQAVERKPMVREVVESKLKVWVWMRELAEWSKWMKRARQAAEPSSTRLMRKSLEPK